MSKNANLEDLESLVETINNLGLGYRVRIIVMSDEDYGTLIPRTFNAFAQIHSVDMAHIMSKTRIRKVVDARIMATHFLCKVHQISYLLVAKFLQKDRTTIIHYLDKHVEYMQNIKYRKLYESIAN